jgi:ATP-dependent Clp protease ATP-binding subunit ClpC
MATLELSVEAQFVLTNANDYAHNHQHALLDGAHVFLSILQNSEAGKNWLTLNASDYLIVSLQENLNNWYLNNVDGTELSSTYIRIMKKAEEYSIKFRSQEISSDHLLAAILDIDDKVTDWLGNQGIQFASISLSTPLLDELGRDLVSLAKNHQLSEVIGREDEVKQIIEILLRRGKNSVLLLGEPGVGKTAVVERLAQDILAKKVPVKLQKHRLVEINIANLISGTAYRGQFEERLQQLLLEINEAKNIIIIIDEFHTVMGAGTTRESSLDVSNILKPAIARGELTCIGITTNSEYSRYIERDQAFTRRFENVRVSEPDKFETKAILTGLVDKYEQHHNLKIDTSIIEIIVNLCAQYLPSRRFPDKAIDILGRACSRSEIQGNRYIEAKMIPQIISEIAGVPVGHMTMETRVMLNSLEEKLSQTVIGQQHAISVLTKAIRLSYAGLRDSNRPKGVFMFIGPSGVGKTQLAKSIAEVLFGDDKALIRLDMSEFGDKYTVSRLIGAPPGYVGHENPGQLIQLLHDRPHSIVLLDEIEKAHHDIFDIFLQLFDEGRLTDTHGKTVDGRHALFVMTSNLGADIKEPKTFGFNQKKNETAINIHEVLRNHFRPEFLNRVDQIIEFRNLDADDLFEIVEIALMDLNVSLKKQNIKLTYEQNVADFIAQKAMLRQKGARGVDRVIEDIISAPISNLLLSSTSENNNWIHIEYQNNEIALGWV